MKFLLSLILWCLTLFCFGQTWQSAYDSCLKYQELQKFKQALEWGDKALELYEKQVSPKDTNYSNILNRQMKICYYLGQYKKSELYAKKDSAWAKTTNDLKRYADACNNLAILYKVQGKYSEAELLCKESMATRAKALGKEHRDYATSCNNLAFLYQEHGKYSESEPLYKEAKEIYAKVLGKDHPSYATSCNNLALLYEKQGKYSESEPLYKEAKEIFAKVLGKEHPNHALSCNNLAGLYIAQGKYSESEPLFKEAKEIYAKLLGKEHPLYALSCNNLAVLYEKQGKYSETEPLYKEAKEIYAKVLGKDHPDYAQSCNNLAVLYEKQGKYSEAEKLFKETREIITKTLGKDHPLYATSCKNLAILCQKQDKYNEAETLFKEVLQTKFKEIEQNFKNLSEAEKESYIKVNVEGYFNNFQSFVQKRYTQNPAITEDSYNLTIATKGLILQSTEKIKNRILNSKDEQLIQLYQEWKQTKDKYVKALNLTIAQREQKGINLQELAQKANELEKQLALKSEDFAHTFTQKPATWKDIQNVLKKDQAAIEMVRINAKDSVIYIALIIKKNSQYPEIVVLPNGNTLETQYLTYYRRSIVSKMLDEENYNALWKPLKDQLKGIKTVYFSPEGLYNQVNLNTLQNPETKKYVFDEIQIINVTNTKDILQQKKAVSKNSYLIGNPKFNLEIDTKGNEKPIEQRSIENLSQLEGAEKEVKQASNFFQNATTIIGEQATEEYVKSIKNPRVLHVATHGYFKKGQYQSATQAMLNAGLLFAGVIDYDRMDIRPFDKDDGKLTAFEVMNMELDSTELVVLSACETGLGQASKEGVYGLQRSFKVAGAQTIIMSLWKVNDEATQLLMTKFYENWQKKGMNKRKAFETAQQDLRKKYKEPYYWGAFVMIE